ncbi:hypothetical protein D9Q98_009993 [Chlorella vulgaris]|uniref:Glutathione S-transferase 3, mitochondrial n=1 Tax=Chlorella vulgaris TaxID=3077 RepID=A0A9D4TFY9_CHLVU|nr:hypothetical protein D9Q98_009993 [Chlorella vulgaris]
MTLDPRAIALRDEHGFVLAAVVWSILLHHFWMASFVVNARKKFGISYPNMYAPPAHKNRNEFDCIQRAHQNSLENQPAFLILLLLAGLRFPVSASIAGAVYLLGRVVYVLCYSGGDPKARYRGAFMYLGNLALMGMVVRWAVELLFPLVKQI